MHEKRFPERLKVFFLNVRVAGSLRVCSGVITKLSNRNSWSVMTERKKKVSYRNIYKKGENGKEKG